MRQEILTGVERRRRWSQEDKHRILSEMGVEGASVSDVARRHDVTRQHLYQWRRELRRTRREHRTLVLWDETGHSLRIRPGTTWARRGLTPVLQRVSKRREVSSVVAITPDGRLVARHLRTSISSHCVIQALRFFRHKIGTPLLVVWDRLNAHRSQATTDFIASHAQDYAVAYLPAYAPELNPEEQCNALIKRAMANALP
ncbi:transposase [Microvirga terrae]|uniref:Transposase n=1 Tax=Microvirga terrae TaxID=2740529 RepID=A0ABY5RNE6_9HYPH|nr:transposase [Microvirga terrae]UVF18404.1 transposase [Microvirga terrae]